jgi:hypothetical protein
VATFIQVSKMRPGGPGSIPGTKRNKKVVGLEEGSISLVSTTEELLENREYGRRDTSRWPCGTLYPQKLAITSPTSGGRSVGVVRSRTQTMEFVCFVCLSLLLLRAEYLAHLILFHFITLKMYTLKHCLTLSKVKCVSLIQISKQRPHTTSQRRVESLWPCSTQSSRKRLKRRVTPPNKPLTLERLGLHPSLASLASAIEEYILLHIK